MPLRHVIKSCVFYETARHDRRDAWAQEAVVCATAFIGLTDRRVQAAPRHRSRAATCSDPKQDRSPPFARRLARRTVRRRAASGRYAEEWLRSRSATAERRAHNRERNTPLRSRTLGPRLRGRTYSRARTQRSPRPRQGSLRDRTTLSVRSRGTRASRRHGGGQGASRALLRRRCRSECAPGATADKRRPLNLSQTRAA